MKQPVRKLNAKNIETITRTFKDELSRIGTSIQGKTGLPLLLALKREALKHGPYTGVSLFEAANRIMSDLVILQGVAGLLRDSSFPFKEYTVEFGNEDKNGFDLRASSGAKQLMGEAFNVAPSFFQVKKRSVLRKLNEKAKDAAVRILMYNADAVPCDYEPRLAPGFVHVLVSIDSGEITVKRNRAA